MGNDSHTDQTRSRRRIADWSLEKVAKAANGELIGEDCAGLTARAVCSDTRKLQRGELFVALRGENFDSHDFLDQAKDKGAVAALVDRADIDTDLPLIVVDDSLDGLTALGRALWKEATDEGLHTIDVTGSNGKTTVKEMLAVLWSTRGEVFATPGNLNNHIGVPLVLCDLPRLCDHLIVELGANAPGEISHLVRLAPGSERVITSIGVAHIEGFGSVDGIRAAKAEIFEQADADTTAVVPYSEVEHLVAADFPGRVLTVGFEEDADVHVELVDSQPSEPDTLRFRASVAGEQLTISLPLPGLHNAVNAATALSTLAARGDLPSQDTCSAQFSRLVLPGGRWRVIDRGDTRFVDDAYNANPSSVKASFEAFMNTTDAHERPRIAVIGEMLELGADAEQWHRNVAAAIADNDRLDGFAAVGTFAEQMAEAASEAARCELETESFETVDDVGDWLMAKGSAFVFLKASRGARLERVVDLVETTSENRGAKQT